MGGEWACIQETDRRSDGPFLTYRREHDGLAVNGLPLTGAYTEQSGLGDSGRYTVQYFERVQPELHAENRAQYTILLGQFGQRIVDASDPTAPQPATILARRGRFYRNTRDVRVRLGPLTSAERSEAGTFQEFERGSIFYTGGILSDSQEPQQSTMPFTYIFYTIHRVESRYQ